MSVRDRLAGVSAGDVYDWFDTRFDLEQGRTLLGKAFPAEDSFLLGEVALVCFLVLVLTGTFLGFFFEPSTSEVTYEGSVAKYQGQELPESYVSVLHITYDIPYGMLLRRMHHWAAHLFVASLSLHMLRVFFTGAYRNPREPNWVVGATLAGLSMFAAYTGYALPFDEFAATATGIGYNMAKSVPVVGDLAAKVVFGGSFPSSATIPRFYFFHVFLLPVAIAGLIGVHMLILMRQKHTEKARDGPVEGRPATDGDGLPATDADAGSAGDGDGGPATDGDAHVATDGHGTAQVAAEDDSVVVGLPAFPNQAAVTAVVTFLTMATLSLLAGFLPVHNVAAYGPNDPASTPALIMPDWFLMWLFGMLKVIPGWLTFSAFGLHFNTEFIGGVVLPGIVFGLLFAWPFLDYYEKPGHFTVDPLARPWQTAIGVVGVLFVMTASLAGMNTIVAEVIGMGTGAVTGLLGVAMVVVPLVGGGVVYATLSRGDAATGDRHQADESEVDEGEVDEGDADEPNRANDDPDEEEGASADGNDDRDDGGEPG